MLNARVGGRTIRINTVNEFSVAIAEEVAYLDEAHKLLMAEVETALKNDDKDKNGKISKEEAQKATDLIEIEIADFDKHFTAADADKDGELNEKGAVL
jgi:hypothetical protein